MTKQVFREVDIQWGGETYTFVPSNAVLRRIEAEVSLASFAMRCQQGDIPISHLAFIAAVAMRSAGADVSEDDMFAELNHGDPDAVMGFAQAIIEALSPVEPDVKKLGGRAAGPSKGKPKKG